MSSGISSALTGDEHQAPRERAMLDRAHALWAGLRASDPEYFAYMEDADPMLARRGELLDLMERAPSDVVFMAIHTYYSVRLQIAQITGREFS